MKRLTILSLSLLFMGCKQDNVQPVKKTQNSVSDSIPYADSDTIDYSGATYFLKIKKLENGFLELNYSLGKKSGPQSFKMKYFDFSDVAFARNGVAVFDGKTTRYNKYYIVRDTILILPVNANDNSLSVNIIDLKNQKVLFDDLRTSLNSFWIYDTSGITCIMADSPEFMDPQYEYKLEEYKFTGSELIKLKQKQWTSNESLKNTITIEKEAVSKMFLSH